MGLSKADKTRSIWMISFENFVICLLPEQRGKVEWDSAVFFYNSGLTPLQAADKYVLSRSKKP
jgi:hypothetical protein